MTLPLSGPEWDAPCVRCDGTGRFATLVPWEEIGCDECNGRGVRDDYVRCPWEAPHLSERDCPLGCDGGVVPYEDAVKWLREGAVIAYNNRR